MRTSCMYLMSSYRPVYQNRFTLTLKNDSQTTIDLLFYFASNNNIVSTSNQA